MIGAIAKLKIKENELDNFKEVMRKLVQAVSENESGCEYYQMHETSDPQIIMMIEIYKDEEAHANHTQTEHFKTIAMELAPFLDGAPEITTHKLIS